MRGLRRCSGWSGGYVCGETGSASCFVGFGFYEGAWGFAVVLLFDVGEEGGVGEVPFSAGATEFSFCLLLGFDVLDRVVCTVFLAH